MKRCDDLQRRYFADVKGDALYCKAKEECRLETCPKKRLQGEISQSCWKVK